MILRQFGVGTAEPAPADQRPMHDQTRCVLAQFERQLPRVDTERTWKLQVDCVLAVTDDRLLNLLGVLTLQVSCDVPGFFALSPPQKKVRTLELLERGLARAIPDQGWNRQPFARAAAAVRASGYRNRWEFCPKWSPGRRFRAFISCSHEPDSFSAALHIQDRSGELVLERELFVTFPSEFVFVPQLGRVRWCTPREVLVTNRAQEEICHVSLNGA